MVSVPNTGSLFFSRRAVGLSTEEILDYLVADISQQMKSRSRVHPSTGEDLGWALRGIYERAGDSMIQIGKYTLGTLATWTSAQYDLFEGKQGYRVKSAGLFKTVHYELTILERGSTGTYRPKHTEHFFSVPLTSRFLYIDPSAMLPKLTQRQSPAQG